MTRKELVERFSEFEDFESKAQAERAYDHLIGIIIDELKDGNEVAIGNVFGTFKIVKQAGRSGEINGVKYKTEPKNAVKFKPSAALKREVAGEQ